MSSTNKTLTIELSQYVGTDKPTYLVDYNGDMLKIDNAIAADRDSITTAQSKADGADAKADINAGAITTLDNQINNASNGLGKRVTDVEGDVNTIESLIGNGTPTTSDKTLIGAINELDTIKLNIADLTASVVPVSPISGMSATNVQSAIEELASLEPVEHTTFGTSIDLSNYTDSNLYTTPTDGYAVAYNDGTLGTTRIDISDGTTSISNITPAASGTTVKTIFVKKGLKLWGTASGGASNVRFYPLV